LVQKLQEKLHGPKLPCTQNIKKHQEDT